MEAQLLIHCNEGTSGCSHSNLDPMKRSKQHWEYGNFSPYALLYEHNSYDCYEGNRLGTRNGHSERTYKRVLRNQVGNEGNLLNMDGRFYKKKRRRMGSQPIKTWSLMKQTLRNRFGVENNERQGQGQSEVKFMKPSKDEESPKVKELSQGKIDEILKIYFEKETPKREPSCIMSEKIEIKEKKEWKKKRD
ncbi:hypothetical protein M9H77_16689 [Catharanthus roseus]|uniref:Uncharacterized protein n=1 Tax=Catharanthus roseus TaxID=4058 RepID=A0ACC0B2H3_CATRO|nr:hypothetical protein M9H77_16689 [Catharanthus roseus]